MSATLLPSNDPAATPLRLKDMTPGAVLTAIAAQPRLIIPVGTCEQHGSHLPLGCDTIIVEHIADALSAEFGIVRTPTIEYGVNQPSKALCAGNASVRRKTLRRFLNDMLTEWESTGVTEFLILTMHGNAPHQEALGTVITNHARVRVIDILALDFSTLVEGPIGPIHGGEIDTSLLLYVAPHLVQMQQARDFILPEQAAARYRRGSTMEFRGHAEGSIGMPSRASAETGRRVYELILDRIRTRVLAPNSPKVPG